MSLYETEFFKKFKMAVDSGSTPRSQFERRDRLGVGHI
jgi:hypothetical protein